MNTGDRISLYESLIGTFLTHARDRGHVVFEVLGDPDEYVQYQVRGGGICGEVGSRQWSEPERPLRPEVVETLARLGFTGGGSERNYAMDGLPRSARDLAQLTDRLLRTAYDLDDDFAPVVREIDPNDVTLPRAERFTREMIAAHLRENDIRFLRDEDGDLRVDLRGPDGGVDSVWFIAEGEGEAVYRITSCTWRVPATRMEALERCNTWNREHRWPKAFVVDDDEGWRVFLCADIDLEPGVTRALFDTFTRHVATGMVEFWTSATSAGSAPRSGRRRRPRPDGDRG